jgi:hypothetical protein
MQLFTVMILLIFSESQWLVALIQLKNSTGSSSWASNLLSLLLNDRLNTRNILRSHNKHLEEGYNCVLCHENVEETAYHLFFDCSAAATRWFSFGITWDDSMDICQKIVVDIGCGPNHTPERALNAQAATDQRTQRRCHSYVVKHGVVYKQTTKG